MFFRHAAESESDHTMSVGQLVDIAFLIYQLTSVHDHLLGLFALSPSPVVAHLTSSRGPDVRRNHFVPQMFPLQLPFQVSDRPPRSVTERSGKCNGRALIASWTGK
ncbi:hypothetical protein J6590_006664 [Homalodisca vitripennis]|nr:hypothetical protein J6590_006664 [Homalodisca vitripennis]